MNAPSTSSSTFFETKYRQASDPWNFLQSPYENARYDAIVAALAYRRYRRALEPGCSIGVLTQRLAPLCDRLEASDFSPTAAAQARRRCAHLLNVTVSCAAFPADLDIVSANQPLPDLIVLSEIGYYFSLDDWSRHASTLVAQLPVGATLLAAHWTGSSPDHQIDGNQVHGVLLALPSLHLDHSEKHDAFLLDRFTRVTDVVEGARR